MRSAGYIWYVSFITEMPRVEFARDNMGGSPCHHCLDYIIFTSLLLLTLHYVYIINIVSAGHCWSRLVSNGLCWSLLVSSGLQWSPVVSAGLQWSLLVSSGLCWSLLVSTGLCWSLLVSTGLCWSLLVSSSLR